MMMMPRRNGVDLFDEVFNDPFFGRKESKLMKTDIREKEGEYVLDIDLPGFSKDDIKIDLNEGYLTVSASKTEETEEKDKHDKFLHKERFVGECSRSYYVGEGLKEENIRANFKNGTLQIAFPKEETKELENEKKYIPIGD